MKYRIYPTEVTVDCYIVPSGFNDAGRTCFTVSISDKKHEKELLSTFDYFEAAAFGRRSAGQRRIPFVDKAEGSFLTERGWICPRTRDVQT